MFWAHIVILLHRKIAFVVFVSIKWDHLNSWLCYTFTQHDSLASFAYKTVNFGVFRKRCTDDSIIGGTLASCFRCLDTTFNVVIEDELNQLGSEYTEFVDIQNFIEVDFFFCKCVQNCNFGFR